MREETIKARGERDDVFRANDTHSTAPNGSGGTALPENLAPTTRESPKTSRSSTPKGDAKARAAAFIADLKRSRQEAEKASADTSAVENANRENVAATEDPLDRTHDPVEHDPGVHDRDRERLEEEDTVTTASFVRDEPKHNRLGEASRQTVTETRPPLQPRSQPSSRSSTLLHSPRYPQPGHSSGPVAQPPLLRRRPLPMAIQASGELQRARTAGERVRIYAMKINELNAEKSRLDEWIDAVRVPHPVLAGRGRSRLSLTSWRVALLTGPVLTHSDPRFTLICGASQRTVLQQRNHPSKQRDRSVKTRRRRLSRHEETDTERKRLFRHRSDRETSRVLRRLRRIQALS